MYTDELDDMEYEAGVANNKLGKLLKSLRNSNVWITNWSKANIDVDAEVTLSKGYAIQISGDGSMMIVKDLGNDQSEFHFDKETKSIPKMVSIVKALGL